MHLNSIQETKPKASLCPKPQASLLQSHCTCSLAKKKRIMTKKVHYGQRYKVPLIITQTHLFKALSHHCSLCAEPQLQRRSDFAFFAKILPYLSLKTILVLVTSACENHRLERHECLKFFFFPLKCTHCNRYCKGSFVCLWIKAGFRH